MKFTVLFMLCCAWVLHAQTFTLTSPATGDSCKQGDTLVVNFSADSAYLNGGKVSGAVIWLSVQGKPYVQLHPISNTDMGINKVFPDDPFWGKAPILFPDTVFYIASDGSPTPVYTVSDSVLIKVMDYENHKITTASHRIKVRPKSPNAVSYNYSPKVSRRKISVHNGTLTSDAAFASVRFYNFQGQYMGGSERLFKKEIRTGGIIIDGASVAMCTFADNTQTSIVLINIH
jgi:hypothetical protein